MTNSLKNLITLGNDSDHNTRILNKLSDLQGIRLTQVTQYLNQVCKAISGNSRSDRSSSNQDIDAFAQDLSRIRQVCIPAKGDAVEEDLFQAMDLVFNLLCQNAWMISRLPRSYLTYPKRWNFRGKARLELNHFKVEVFVTPHFATLAETTDARQKSDLLLFIKIEITVTDEHPDLRTLLKKNTMAVSKLPKEIIGLETKTLSEDSEAVDAS